MIVKRSVTGSIARALAGIVVLSVLSTSLALLTLFGSLRDAEAVNVAGSLRMQSYRLAWDIATQSPSFAQHLQNYQQSLDAPALQHLTRFYVPSSVSSRYQNLRAGWPALKQDLLEGNAKSYPQHATNYVAEIDNFVSDLQRYAELKMRLVAISSTIGFTAIVALAIWTIRLTRRQIVKPLNQLVSASRYIEQGNFNYPALDTQLHNELGALATTFTRMSGQLEKHYLLLEQTVKEKTESLTRANHTLAILFEGAQALAVSRIDRAAFERMLEIVCQRAQLACIEIRIGEDWLVRQGDEDSQQPWQSLPLRQQENRVGELRWQVNSNAPQPQLMQSVANMLARNVWIYEAQKRHQQLLLMEERATIARELHDSLAQALSFLRIQLTLLKRAVEKENAPAQTIIHDFDRALSDAYRQLRELLTTFRLTIDQADLAAALHEMIAPLRNQTTAEIVLDCQLAAQMLDAQQQIHVLQIIREALLNAIKHAFATKIEVHCVALNNGDSQIEILDNGTGIASTEEPQGHYGLTIMTERAERLGGKLTISRNETQGTRVSLRFSPRSATRTD